MVKTKKDKAPKSPPGNTQENAPVVDKQGQESKPDAPVLSPATEKKPEQVQSAKQKDLEDKEAKIKEEDEYGKAKEL